MYYFTLQVLQKILSYINKKLETPPVEGGISFPFSIVLNSLFFFLKAPIQQGIWNT